jgi:2-dehydropantoate 2-reductase
MSTAVGVLGPGAVGGALAVRLVNAGVRTICVTHPEAAGIIALSGIVVETPSGTVSARMEASERLATPVALLLVTVKAPMLEEALQRVDPEVVADGVVVPLLNGLEHMEALRRRFDGRVAAGTIAHYQSYRVGRVQIVETTPNPVVTIASDSLPRSDVERVAEILRSGNVDTRIGQSEKRVLWHKLARIAALAAATSASRRTVGELRADPDWQARLEHALVETCRVAEADGVPMGFAEQWKTIERMAAETTTSAARDVAAGRRSELDAIVGSVLRVAERHGVPCPALTDLATRAGLL